MTGAAFAQPFFGWRVVAAAFVMALFGWGVGFYGPPIYLQAVIERTGWSVAFVSCAVTLHFFVGTLVIINLPRLYCVWSISTVTGIGASSLAIGTLGWALADRPWQLFVAALVSGVGWVAMGAAAVNAIVTPWFSKNRPIALALAYNGASLGGIIFAPLWVALIGSLGFTWAAALVGIAMMLILWPISLLIFARTPEHMGQGVDGAAMGEVRPAARYTKPLPGALLWVDRGFLTLAAGMALGLFAQIGLIAHLFSLLVPALGERQAGLAMGLATTSAVAGRTLVGWLLPFATDRRLVACASYAIQILGSLTFIGAAGHDIPLLIGGIVFFGAGIGNATSLPPLIAQVEFDRTDVVRVVSLIVAIAQGLYALAPMTFGYLRSAASASGLGSGSDGMFCFVAAAAIQFLTILCFLAGRRRR
jgi:Major Facilitator Superfamily